MKRKQISEEVDEDLAKPYRQLLDDIHDELLNPKRKDVENIKHSLKRISSLFAKMGMDSQRTQKWVMIFTVIVIILVISQLIILLI